MSRLVIEVTEQQHQNLKAMAALQGKTIKQYTLERLALDTQETDHALAELRSCLQDRIAAGLAGQVSRKTLEEILAEEMQESLQH